MQISGKYEDLSFVLASSYRTEILKSLLKNVGTPSTISKDIGKSITHVSRCLRQLSDKNLLECLTPDNRKGKIYKITDKGIEAISSILKITGKNINGVN